MNTNKWPEFELFHFQHAHLVPFSELFPVDNWQWNSIFRIATSRHDQREEQNPRFRLACPLFFRFTRVTATNLSAACMERIGLPNVEPEFPNEMRLATLRLKLGCTIFFPLEKFGIVRHGNSSNRNGSTARKATFSQWIVSSRFNKNWCGCARKRKPTRLEDLEIVGNSRGRKKLRSAKKMDNPCTIPQPGMHWPHALHSNCPTAHS